MALNPGTLHVTAIAIKASDLPNRFGLFEVEVTTGVAVVAGKVDELLRCTKDICTVSNRLGAEVVVRINSARS